MVRRYAAASVSPPKEGPGPAGQNASSGPQRWPRLLLLAVLFYVFLLSVDVLGEGLGALGEDLTEQLFQGIENPLVGLFVGVLATVLAQSSSVTTSTVVGLVGAGVLGVEESVPIVMGANIGTTVTNTFASLGSIRRVEEFRRAFTGATMHDVFNVLTVVVLLPLELATGLLSRVAVAVSGLVPTGAGGEFESPLAAAVDDVTAALAAGAEALAGVTPLKGVLLILLGLAGIFGALYLITRVMKVVVAGPAERSLNAVLGRTGVLGILVGALLTIAVQSSSICTSLLIPMIAAGVLRLENAYPLTLGANLGTTLTALLASLAVENIGGLQIALVHLAFNVAGMLIFYPVPVLRRVPLRVARAIADFAVERRALALVYIVVAFYVVPLLGILVLR